MTEPFLSNSKPSQIKQSKLLYEKENFSCVGKETSSGGSGGGVGFLITVLVFISDDPSLNPPTAYSFSVKCLEKRK